MTTFDNRESAFENRFTNDKELEFKAHARRNRLLGEWVASQYLRYDKTEAEAYALALVDYDLQQAGQEDVFKKICDDIKAAGKEVKEKDIRNKMLEFLGIAKQQMKEKR